MGPAEFAVVRLKKHWDEIAAVDPLWAILIDSRYRDGGWPRADFFRTGEVEVEEILAAAKSLQRPKAWTRAMDFGCGVGRLTRAMSGRFEDCVGVDISDKMLELAKDMNRDRPNCRFVSNVRSDLQQFDSESFDFIYSSLVLQHMPHREVALAYIKEFIRLVKEGGLIVFQLPYTLHWSARLQLRLRTYSALRKVHMTPSFLHKYLLLHPMNLISIPEPLVFDCVQQAGGTVLRVERDHPPRLIRSIRYYVARR